MLLGKECTNNHHAYVGTTTGSSKSPAITDYTCKYSFAEPEVFGVADPSRKNKFNGYDLKFVSD